MLSCALFAAILVVCPAAAAASDDNGENVLRIPGLPPIPLPPGARAQPDARNAETPRDTGPHEPPPAGFGRSPAPQPDAAGKDSAPTPAPPPVPPEKRLADLYGRLAKASDADEAQGIAGALERQWLFTASDTAGLIMTRALGAMQRNELPLALELLDKLVALEPQWAEAWNKRATIRFMTDDYAGSMEDIGHVLALDAKHFGALMGMGTILQRSGNDKRALEAYRRVHEIYPALDNVKRIIDTLAPDVDGRDI